MATLLTNVKIVWAAIRAQESLEPQSETLTSATNANDIDRGCEATKSQL